MSLDAAQAALQDAHLGLRRRDLRATPRTVAKGIVLALRPQGRHRRSSRGAAVDLVVSKGPRPGQGPGLDRQGRRRGDQRRCEKLRFEVERRTRRTATPSTRAT